MFTGRFRFAWDESYLAERPDRRTVEAAWFTRIPCRFGFIAPHGGPRLFAYTTTRRRALSSLRCVTVHQQGEREVGVLFHVADIEAVANVLSARRPRRTSPEDLERLRQQGFQSHTAEIFEVRKGEPRTGHPHVATSPPSTRIRPEFDGERCALDVFGPAVTRTTA